MHTLLTHLILKTQILYLTLAAAYSSFRTSSLASAFPVYANSQYNREALGQTCGCYSRPPHSKILTDFICHTLGIAESLAFGEDNEAFFSPFTLKQDGNSPQAKLKASEVALKPMGDVTMVLHVV